MLGLYVHIPFCSAICNYCNFNRGLFDEALKTRFVEALLEEIRGAASSHSLIPSPLSPDTLYFGGGTPSLLTPPKSNPSSTKVAVRSALSADAEITLEANPETRRPGAPRRISRGRRESAQLRCAVVPGRRAAAARPASLGRARQAGGGDGALRGFDNVSIDLMMWLPGQDVQQWLTSVEDAIRVAPDHLSLYILEVYPHLPLKQEIDRHGWTQERDEGAAEMYETAMSMLDAAGLSSSTKSPTSASRAVIAPQSEILDGRRVVGVRAGRAFDVAGQPVAECLVHRRLRSADRCGATVIVDRRRLSNDERLGDALFTGFD